jgi:hypothetical protein
LKFAKKIKLEVDVSSVDELIDSSGAELSNENLMELEAAKVPEQTEDGAVNCHDASAPK